MRVGGFAFLLWGLALLAGPVQAQSTVAAPVSALLTLDDQRLFSESRFGKALLVQQDAEKQALAMENRQIEAALETEERELTTRRASLTKEEFAPLSEAFNVKVEGIRKAQETKSRELTRRFEEERRHFFEVASPVLGQILVERGALAIIDKRVVFLGFENLDITDSAIARLDSVLGDGTSAPNPDPAPAPLTPAAPAAPADPGQPANP